MLNVRGWKQYIVGALDLLPAELREQFIITTEALEPRRCETCGFSWFRPDLDGPVCHVCNRGLFGVDPMELIASCPQVGLELRGVVLLRATLIHRVKASYIVLAARAFQWPWGTGVAPTLFSEFKVGSAKRENSAAALQRTIRDFVYPHLGLTTDRDGHWGWPKGLRLDGTPRVPDLCELIDMFEQQSEGRTPDPSL